MFDAHTPSDDQHTDALVPLPHAEQLRAGHNRRHVPRLHVRSEREETRARELAREAR